MLKKKAENEISLKNKAELIQFDRLYSLIIIRQLNWIWDQPMTLMLNCWSWNKNFAGKPKLSSITSGYHAY